VLSEAFPPQILLRAMESRNDSLLQARACYATRRALYEGGIKLIQTGESPSLYNLEQDPAEQRDLLLAEPGDPALGSLSPQAWLIRLQQGLRRWLEWAESRRPSLAPRKVDVESDADLLRRMQELGYLE
jgi:uncharacterized sulfatase